MGSIARQRTTTVLRQSQAHFSSWQSPMTRSQAARTCCSTQPEQIPHRSRPGPLWSSSWRMRSRPFASRGQTFRQFSSTPTQRHGHIDPPKAGEERHVTFIDKEGRSHTYEVSDGSNLLDIAQANDLEMEGACGGSCACSTCHVIVEDGDMYDKMEEPDDDENDMLDLAFGLTETSRLGCQIKMSKEMDGLVVKLPTMTRNMQASDFAKK